MDFLRRYTSLSSIIHILRNKKLTLLNPTNWDDRNDSKLIEGYRAYLTRKCEREKVVLALCFSEGTEKYHHWRVFAPGGDGCRIKFDKRQLLSALDGIPGIESGCVQYRSLKKLKGAIKNSQYPEPEHLPFLKRRAFKDEKEFRIIYTDNYNKKESSQSKGFDIPIKCIAQIKLSPWMPKSLATAVKNELKTIEGCSSLDVIKSTMTDNETWKTFSNGCVSGY